MALGQAGMKANKQTLCVSTLTLAREAVQHDASKVTAEKYCLEQLNKELPEKQTLLVKNIRKKLAELYSSLPSAILGTAFNVDQCLLAWRTGEVSEHCPGRDTLAQSWQSRAEQSQSHDKAI